MIHGYARCSTNESKQDIDRQVRELKQAGAENIFLEYEHGDAVVKCQLSSLLEQAQAGDTIITLEVSRLARSTKQLCEIIEAIRAKRLRLVIVGSITVDCSNGDKCVHSNVGRVCGIGIAYHSGAREVGNGKRQGQGRKNRKTYADRRRHSADLPTALPRVQE